MPLSNPYWSTEDHNLQLFHGDAMELLATMDENSIDCIWTDPPYNLSNDGITCVGGKMVSVNKGSWDKSKGLELDHSFNLQWTKACYRVLKPTGTIWITGTLHAHPSIGFALQSNGFRLLNDIVWEKRNPPPNIARKTFTHASEIVYWASKAQRGDKPQYKFNYEQMREENGGKQMKSVWQFSAATAKEKKLGKHPTQKPIALVTRCLRASTDPGDTVLDPFSGSGTTGIAALNLGRRFLGFELVEEYVALATQRLENEITNSNTPPRHWSYVQYYTWSFLDLTMSMSGSDALFRLRLLIGQDLRMIANQYDITVYREGKLNKGWAGHAVERYLGLPINSSQSPNLGSWELKVVPVIPDGSEKLKLKETMAITMLDPYEVSIKEFKDSHLFTKLNKLILVVREHVDDHSRSLVLGCTAFDLSHSNLREAIEQDYESIRNALSNGQALTGHMGTYIQPRTKGTGHGSTSRAFYARKNLVAEMVDLSSLSNSLRSSGDCPEHSGRLQILNRRELDDLMETLPNNQSGKGRHKCPYCAYHAGYKDGLAARP